MENEIPLGFSSRAVAVPLYDVKGKIPFSDLQAHLAASPRRETLVLGTVVDTPRRNILHREEPPLIELTVNGQQVTYLRPQKGTTYLDQVKKWMMWKEGRGKAVADDLRVVVGWLNADMYFAALLAGRALPNGVSVDDIGKGKPLRDLVGYATRRGVHNFEGLGNVVSFYEGARRLVTEPVPVGAA